jgi:hypothetical protein
MAYAAMLSLEKVGGAHRRTEVPQRPHDGVDRWLQQVEDHLKEPQPTLEEPAPALLALRQEVTQAVTEGVGGRVHRAQVFRGLVVRDQREADAGPALSHIPWHLCPGPYAIPPTKPKPLKVNGS